MGGYATWDLAMEFPDFFAAIAPIACAGAAERVEVLRNLPVWAFHGAKDDVVPVRDAVAIVKALKAAGGKGKLTVYPEVGHDAWTDAYQDVRLYEWLLEHERV